MGHGVLELDRDVRVELRAWLDGLSGIARKVNEGASLKELLDVIAATTCELTGYDFSAILLPNKQRTALLIVGSCGMRPEYIREVNTHHPIRVGPTDFGEAPTSRAFRCQRPVHIKDVWEARSCAPWEAVAHQQGNRSLLSLPLMTSRGPVGVLNCYTRFPRDFSGDDVVFMETLANQAALAIEAATLNSNERARIQRLDRLNRELREQQEDLSKAERAHQQLMRLVLEDRDLRDLTLSLARITSSMVLITDDHGRLLAACPDDFGEALRRYLTRGGGNTPVAADSESGRPEPFATVLRLPVAGEGAGLPAVEVPVLLNGEVVAHLWSVRARPGEPHVAVERRIIERAAVVVGLVISKERAAQEAQWRVSRDLLDELLLPGRRIDPMTVVEWGRHLGVDLLEPQVLLVLGPVPQASAAGATEERRARVLLGRVQQVLKETSVAGVASVRGSEAIVLYPAEGRRTGQRSPEELARLFLRALRRPSDTPLGVAISPQCERIENYPSAYETARRALGLLADNPHHDPVVDVRQLGVYQILLNASRPTELARFARQVLEPLEIYEAQHGGDLLRTLRVFLRTDGSATAAGQELFVHTNTVRYRIRRVEELLGISLANDEDRLQVKLALMIGDVAGFIEA